MKLPAIADLMWRMKRTLRAVGWQVPALAAAALATVVAYTTLLMPLESTVAGVKQDAETLRGKMATRVAEHQTEDPTVRLQDFYRHFPAPGTVPDTLQAIFAAAAAANLSLDHAEYRLAAEPVGELSRYDIVIPLKGRYGQMRQFLAQILKEQPNLALEGVRFDRQGVADIGVEAQLRLTLYLRGQS